MTNIAHRSDRIEALMAPLVRCIDEEATLRQAAASMRTAEVGVIAVADEGDVVGIISERDIVRAVAEKLDLDTERVGAIMTREPRYLTLADSVLTSAHVMLAAGIRHLPVVDEGELVGIVSIRDVAGALLAPQEEGAPAAPLEVEQELSHPGG